MNDEADIVTIVSSDLIATVMEDYFNKKMYKLPVKIVELKPTEAGYSFFLQFVPKSTEQLSTIISKFVPNGDQAAPLAKIRDNKGKFVKKE